MPWTEERIEIVRQLAGQGYSAGAIADHLGDVTRNAVIGIGHRQKFQFFGQSGGAGGGERTVRRNAHYTRKPRAEAPIVELPRMVTIEELRPEDCRYIFLDVQDPAHRYCGAEGYPWCSTHRALVYQTIEERRRASAMQGTSGSNRRFGHSVHNGQFE
jgi:hypothetical protein